MKRVFEVRFYWERWVSDTSTEKINHQINFECDVFDGIAFNGQGIFGIVSDALKKNEKEKYGKSVTVTSVRELRQAEDGHWF